MEKDPAISNNSLEAEQYIDDMRRHHESTKNISPYRTDETIMAEPVEPVIVQPIKRYSKSYNTSQPTVFKPNKATACEGIDNPEIFENESTVAAAILICAVCLVSADCLAYAIKHKTSGVWGGMTEKERNKIIRSSRIK